MTTFTITILRRSAMTISFQTTSFNDAVTQSAKTIASWRHDHHDPIQRVFISEWEQPRGLQEYRPEEVVEMAAQLTIVKT